MAWNAGYVTDINYTYGYYSDLNPVRLAAAVAGLSSRFPQIKNACELGFGQGMSINIHAAAQPGVTWWGNDFNPAQAAFAQELATAAGSGAQLSDGSFAEFCAREDLPEFELIVLHGIWSWVSDENRHIIIDFIRRKLAVGGVVYVSYNAMPGWAAPAPIRHLIKTHGELMTASAAGLVPRFDAALNFVEQMIEADPAYMRGNPLSVERFKSLKTQNREYLVHEYMNTDWQPMYFTEFAKWMEPTKTNFIGAAHFIEQQEVVNMTPAQIAFLAAIPDLHMRETARDYMVHQQFRRDLWVKGARRLTTIEHAEAYRRLRYVMTMVRENVPTKVSGQQGEATLNEAIYNPILDYLADYQIKTFAQIEQAVTAKGVNMSQLVSALGLLMGVGAVSTAQDDRTISKAKASTDKLNAALMHHARTRGDIAHLASPVIGGGVNINRFDQLFMLARAQGRKTPGEWAEFAHGLLSAQGQKLVKEGKTLETPEENLAELQAHAQSFDQKRLPLARALGVV